MYWTKRIFTCVLVGILIVASLPLSVSAKDYEFHENDTYWYEVTTEFGEPGIRIWRYLSEENLSVIEVPAEIDGYPVIAIGENAFVWNTNALETLILPEGLKYVEKSAFSGCKKLKEIVFPSSLISIGDDAFAFCPQLPSVSIPEGVRELGRCVFYGCKALREATIANSVTTIGDCTFLKCPSLVTAKVPMVSGGMFRDCPELREVIFSDTITRIDDYAFYNCPSLTSENFAIPDTVTYIGEGAFSLCDSFTSESFALPDAVTFIGEYAFAYCSGLTEINIPRDMTVISDHAFAMMRKLQSIDIPDWITCIGDGAFSGCTALASVKIPESVTEIGNGAFSNCTALTAVTIPETVTYIGEKAFSGCTLLEDLTIPEDLTFLGKDAFAGTAYFTAYRADGSNWEDNMLYLGSYLIEVRPDSGTEFHVKEGTTLIVDYAFSDAYSKSSYCALYLPNSITYVGAKTVLWHRDQYVWVYYDGTPDEWYNVREHRENSYADGRNLVYLIPGDIDRDGHVAASDAMLLRQYLAKLFVFEEEPWETVEANADVNRDGVINARDMLLLRRIVAGLAD